MNTKIFKCEYTGYNININIENDIAHIIDIICDYKYIVSFVALLRKMIDELIELKIKFITITIHKSETVFFNNTSWVPYNMVYDQVYAYCPINDFLQNMDKSLDLSQKN